MEFWINGDKWKIKYVNANSNYLKRSDGALTLGVTDNNEKTVFINNKLHGRLLEKVITHEIVHCFCFSYGIFVSVETEELIADFVATYGAEVLTIVFDILKKLSKSII